MSSIIALLPEQPLRAQQREVCDHRPNDETTVLVSVKGSLAALGGFAALDPACAPWWDGFWTMNETMIGQR